MSTLGIVQKPWKEKKFGAWMHSIMERYMCWQQDVFEWDGYLGGKFWPRTSCWEHLSEHPDRRLAGRSRELLLGALLKAWCDCWVEVAVPPYGPLGFLTVRLTRLFCLLWGRMGTRCSVARDGHFSSQTYVCVRKTLCQAGRVSVGRTQGEATGFLSHIPSVDNPWTVKVSQKSGRSC